MDQTTIWDVTARFTALPQVAHILSFKLSMKNVDNLCTTFLLLACNEGSGEGGWVCGRGFLPTMKLQPSQLP